MRLYWKIFIDEVLLATLPKRFVYKMGEVSLKRLSVGLHIFLEECFQLFQLRGLFGMQLHDLSLFVEQDVPGDG